MSWTEERVEILKKLWAEGKSASQIAKELGGVTRNAVIGKIHRLGLSNRDGGKGGGKARVAKVETAPKAAAPAEEAPVEATPPRPEAAAEAEATEAPATEAAPTAGEEADMSNVTQLPQRRPVPGQPLPPQPSTAEIDPETLATVREVEKKALKLSLMELTERTCKWPIGDPATDEFWFCGLPVQPGKPYCEAHVALAYQPVAAKRDRKSGR